MHGCKSENVCFSLQIEVLGRCDSSYEAIVVDVGGTNIVQNVTGACIFLVGPDSIENFVAVLLTAR